MNLRYDYKNLNSILYTNEKPTPLKNPKLISKNQILLDELNIDLDDCTLTKLLNGESSDEIEYFTMAYSGHQFGYFVPNLGDGRAINFGKIKEYNLQTKGSGETEYSRMGDGRAVLRSSIREYLISEAMFGLGIPTSRALALITSDSQVRREGMEDCAIVLRASESWIRFGTFEYAYIQHDKQLTQDLADYVINESYPDLKNLENKYDQLYYKIVDKTITLMAHWQSFGFCHGVMNSDNMSIAGLTIDYGPFAFLDEFEKEFICNRSDHEGRYAFNNQPFIARWNLEVLAEVMKPIINLEKCKNYNNHFIGRFKQSYMQQMAQKLGLTYKEEDSALILNLFVMLENCYMDYTSFFYYLSCDNINGIRVMSSNIDEFNEWYEDYEKRLNQETISKEKRLKKMLQINPKYVLKNYMLQDAIDLAQKGDYSLVNDLLEIAQNPFDEHKEYEKYAMPSPKKERGLIYSCSS
jgi:uncharacterized protein YdiU (UPF0061 family)